MTRLEQAVKNSRRWPLSAAHTTEEFRSRIERNNRIIRALSAENYTALKKMRKVMGKEFGRYPGTKRTKRVSNADVRKAFFTGKDDPREQALERRAYAARVNRIRGAS